MAEQQTARPQQSLSAEKRVDLAHRKHAPSHHPSSQEKKPVICNSPFQIKEFGCYKTSELFLRN